MATNVFDPPDKTRLSSSWGDRPSGFHSGVDFVSDAPGAKILSLTKGSVVRAGGSTTNNGDCKVGNKNCAGGWGNFVEVKDSSGRLTRYCHMVTHSVQVRPGDSVNVGTYLGDQGETGNSRGIHLHIELEVGGTKVNPVGKVIDSNGMSL